ncbi:flippase [Patescibacteria group bacterium]|nr:flippase [Patescibacteria group bacterium]
MLKQFKQVLLNNNNDSQIMVKNTFWLSISQIASRTIRAIIVIYAARILGAHGYGVFSYALAIIGLGSLFSDFGINRILIKEASKSPLLRSQYIATTLGLKLVLLSTITLIIISLVPHFAKIPEAIPILPIMAVLFFSDGVRNFFYAMIRSVERMEWEAWLNTFVNTITVVISLGLIIVYRSPMALAVAYALSSLIGTVVTMVVMRKDLTNLKTHFNKRMIPPLLLEIWPFALMNILWSVLVYTDTLMLGWMRTASEIGIYAAAQRPVQLLLVVPAVIAGSALPLLSRLAHIHKEKFVSILEKTIAASMLLAFPLTIGGILMSREIISFLYGPTYSSSAVILLTLISAFLITFPTFIIYHAIFANDLQKKFIPHMFFSAITNIGLNLWLVPIYGALGAAIATVTSQYLAYGWIYLALQKRINFIVWPMVYKALIASIVMGLEIYLMKEWHVPFLIQLFVGATTYIAGLFVLKDPLIKWVLSTLQSKMSPADNNTT